VSLPGPAADSTPGAQLLRAVQIMDRLRSPGGCPWDADQTHRSLAPYLLEEAYETLDAIESDDLTSLREELGDLLLQVLFHARLAEEAPEAERFTIDDVAGDLVAKLVRRHPHVFADPADRANPADPADGGLSAAQVAQSWDEIKKVEKQRESVTDGVPLGQPALALAAKLVGRSGKAGLAVPVPAGDGFGEQLLSLVDAAVRAGVDPEHALRETARAYREAILDEERRVRPGS
jgi:XTP/dITP diphosphohydrolase